MKDTIRVALLGLGDIGEAFAEQFLAKIQEHGAPVEIVAVADHHPDSPVALGFSQSGVPVFRDALEVTSLGDKIDIIFDLTGNSRLRQELRLKLIETRNQHTVIATEVLARLLWHFFEQPLQLKATGTGY
jgi:homoserine dehydrogenase